MKSAKFAYSYKVMQRNLENEIAAAGDQKIQKFLLKYSNLMVLISQFPLFHLSKDSDLNEEAISVCRTPHYYFRMLSL